MVLIQKEWRKLLNVIQCLNDGLDDQIIRERAGWALLDLLQADHFASFVWDEEGGVFSRPVFLNMSQDNLRLYEQHYQFHDPITFKMQPYRRAVSVNEVIKQCELLKTEFFNDFLAVDGLHYGINIYVYDSGNRNIGDFRIWRSRKRENFGRRELEILDMIAPHFQSAMRNILFAKRPGTALDLDKIRRQISDRFDLTPREIEVACAVLQGGSDKIISRALHISLPTLRSHIQHLFDKLSVNSRTEFCSKVFLGACERIKERRGIR
ncbi:MAG: helix-turn-helix transcriptional regulator [Gammaproteobacteria bacterium]|nr:helix-turn-helix transcriptional regulator [Gammaproteobacteria bacterium]MCY4256028.1 helix-turn-helix transcriptional regulator [Gammaproteobacteria bacterium]MCY4341133.1 helix-turn-helix transcriptional regulator [Gammaproteobacteria bacterium]